MALVKYWNGIPTRHITTAFPGQQTDFDEELLPQSQDNCLIMKPDGFVLKEGPEILSGFGHHGFRPKRFVFQLTFTPAGTGAAGAAHLVQFIADLDGTRVTLTTVGFNEVGVTGHFTNSDFSLPASICPNTTTVGTITLLIPVVTAAGPTYGTGAVTITPAGVMTVYTSAAQGDWAAATGGFPSWSRTYDTGNYV